MGWPQMRVIKGAGVHHYHHYHYHYHLHLDALPLSKLLGIYIRKMRLIRIFPLSNLNTVILGRTMRGLSCTFPMTQGQDGFSILFLFNREGNATLSLYSSHILLYPTCHHLHHIRWAALARLIKKEQRWSKSPLAPPQCQCAKRVKIATVSTFLRSDRDEGSEAPKAGHCAGCCQKGPLSPWSSSGLIKFVLISFSFLSAHFFQNE